MTTIDLVPLLRAVLFKPDVVRPIDHVIDYFGEGTAADRVSVAGKRPGPADGRSDGS